MSGAAEVIIPIIENIIVNDDIDSPKKQPHRWKIGYSHERITPNSNRLFIWNVQHVDDAKKIVTHFISENVGVQHEIYNGGQLERIEWVFLFHNPI